MNPNSSLDTIISDSRKIERDRRLAEIEESYKNVLRETQEKHDKLYDVVFREKDDVLDSEVEKEMNQFAEMDKIKKNKEKSIFSRITKSLSPAKSDTTQPCSPLESPIKSPGAAASLPDIAPIRLFSARNQTQNAKTMNLRDSYRDGDEELGNNHDGSRFLLTKSILSRPITYVIVGTLFLVSLIIGLAATAKDMEEVLELTTSQRTIRDLLQDLDVDTSAFKDASSPQYNALIFLAGELDSKDLKLDTPLRERDEERNGDGDIIYLNQAYRDHRHILERYALVVLYISTGQYSSRGSTGWSHNDNWLENGVSVCDGWHGIVCTTMPKGTSEASSTVNVVEEINLDDNNLEGTIPSELSLLEDLVTLELGGNRLSGQVPGSLGDLRSLQLLEVSENFLTGDVPVSICDLKEDGSLQKIYTGCGGGVNSLTCECCQEEHEEYTCI